MNLNNIPKINLLPYRQDYKKAVNQRFFQLCGLSVLLACGIGFLIHGFFYNQISAQENRNAFLDKENQRLDTEIAEIKKLREQINATLSRKQVVENLQANRSRAVLFFNEIVTPPDGIYYKSVKQSNDKVTLGGIATSNTAVSVLMKELEISPTLNQPQLIETRSVTSENGQKLIEFSVNATLVDLAKLMEDKSKNKAIGQPATSLAVEDFSNAQATLESLRARRAARINEIKKQQEQK